MMIGEADEAGIGFHEPGVQPPGIGRQRIPHRYIRIVRRELRARGYDAHLELALVDDLAVLVPAHVKLALVLIRPLLGHVVRGVPGAGGVIQEERLVRRGDMRILNELDGLVGQVRRSGDSPSSGCLGCSTAWLS